jgi:AMP nucleosidase
METQTTAQNGRAIVDQLDRLFKASVKHLRDDIEAYIAHGTLPDPAGRTNGRYAYPEIHLTWSGDTGSDEPQRSFGRLAAPGHYVTSVTKPAPARYAAFPASNAAPA